MAEKLNGLSRELIIHPGETLRELLDDRGMSQKVLALRTGFSEKHISKVINGGASITAPFANALENVFNVEAEFWMNLQSNYDIELLKCEEKENVSEDEMSILKNLSSIIKYMRDHGIIPLGLKKQECVLKLRAVLGVNNLTVIPSLAFNAAFRGSSACTVDPYVLFAWQRLCELEAEKNEVANNLDVGKLREQIPNIRKLMTTDVMTMQKELKQIFSDCGIKFCIVKHFTGAPVQGFIEITEEGETILCLTIRGVYADIFWFTLFHEIAHILFGDIKKRFIDFSFTKNDEEQRADEFASNVLLNPETYKDFVTCGDFTLGSINKYSKAEGVPNYIVIGRLQKEKHIPYSVYSREKIRYIWA